MEIVVALPSTVNITLYCIFVARHDLPIGMPDLSLIVFLIYPDFNRYPGVFDCE